MRERIIPVAIALLACGTAAAGRPDSKLGRALTDARGSDPLPIVVLMEDFPETQWLLAQVRGLQREERRARVVQELRARAAASQAPVRALLAKLGVDPEGVRVLWGVNGLALRVRPAVAQRIAELPQVRWVLLDPPLPPEQMYDPGPRRSGARTILPGGGAGATVEGEIIDMGAQRVWDELGVTGVGALVAVVDSGVDRTHPDLADHVWTNPGEIAGNMVDDDANGFADDSWGWDFCDDDADPSPEGSAHGTQVAGQVAGDGTNGRVTGMAPDALLMALRVCEVSTWWEASDYAIANGAHVLTQSVSHKWPSVPNYEAFRRQAFTELAAGVIHANSTGNTGNELGTSPVPYNVAAPGNCPPPWHHPDQTLEGGVTSVIGVANLDYDTKDIAGSSPYGPSAWEEIRAVTDPTYPYYMPLAYQDFPHADGAAMGLIKPDIAAYGQNTLTTCPGPFYCEFSGTSSATPHVAGALALMLSANPAATPEQLGQAILTTAQPYTLEKSNRYGVGLVQAYEAVLAVTSPCSPPAASFTVSATTARVGEGIRFDSTVSGGAGGPYGYRWDVDADGAIDSTAVDLSYAYARPFVGLATLRVEDAAGCLAKVEGPVVTVTGPDLRFHALAALAEIAGNGDGHIEPGETWDMTIDLRNDGNETAVGVSAGVAVHRESPGTVSILMWRAAYPDIPPGQTRTSSTPYRFRVGVGFPCGAAIPFALTAITTTDPANVYPDPPAPMTLPVEAFPQPTLLFSDFEDDGGWAINDEWQIGAPLGLGSPGADPTEAYRKQGVLGTDLTGLGANPGNYENSVTQLVASPFIDLPATVTDVRVDYAQWLNMAPGDRAEVLVNAFGFWELISAESGVSDTAWANRSFDISPEVVGASTFRIQLRIVTDGQGTDAGWNVDAFKVTGTPVDGCEPAGPYPQFDSFGALVEVEGDGDGDIDPGETWELTAALENIGAATAEGVSASIAVHPSTPGAVFLLRSQSSYPAIPSGQVATSAAPYRFRVGSAFPCGQDIVLSMTGIATMHPAASYPGRDEAGVLPVDGCDPFGPFLRYEGIDTLTEFEGNGDARIDPGEIWDVKLVLRNVGGAPALGVSADVAVAALPSGSAFVLQPSATYPDIGAGQVAVSDSAYRVRLGEDFPCGTDLPLTLTAIRTSSPPEVFPDEVAAVALPTADPLIDVVFTDGFETETGWATHSSTGNGEWQRNPPLGLGSPFPDPSSAYAGTFVRGNDLTGLGSFPGNYENDTFALMLSPILDLGPVQNRLDVEFAHWLNLAPGDVADVLVWNDLNFNWNEVFTATGVTATGWTLETLDLSSWVGASRIRVQFRIQTDGGGNASGWNLDAFQVRADTCPAFERSSPGEVRGLTVRPGGPGQLELRWDMDCGGGTTYSIYRGDLSAGYASIAPEPGRCDVVGTTASIPEGPRQGDFFLVVPNRDGTTGSYGSLGGSPRPEPPIVCHPRGAVYACVP